MTLNVLSDRSIPPPGHDGPGLAAEALAELTRWSPRDRIGAFRSWQRGALSVVQLHVLTILEADGPRSMSRLADELDVSVASATGIVDRMERRGIVARQHGTDDRRVVHVRLTDGGRSVFRDLDTQRRDRLARVLEALTDDDLAALLTGIRALRAARERLFDAAPGAPPAVAGS